MTTSVSWGNGVRAGEGTMLLFIYNADSGLFNVLTDYAHKILSPKTYPCTLCAITYGNRGMNKTWKKFIASLSVPVEFLHRDQLQHYGIAEDVKLPAAFLKEGTSLNLLMSQGEINGCSSVDDLMRLVSGKLRAVKA